jgi:hypothetical protein
MDAAAEESSRAFAGELIGRFGEDRFYHALLRFGTPREAMLMHRFIHGTDKGWEEMRAELRLKGGSPSVGLSESMGGEEANILLCRTACTFSLHHRQYALKSAELPPALHARMLLTARNDWTAMYIENLDRSRGDQG